MRIAGVDEAGRGPWAGPVVAAAVVLHQPRFTTRIGDSKRLTAPQRERAYLQIVAQAEVGVGIASAAEIDRLNILQATFVAMQRAVGALGLVPDRILVDGNRAPALPAPCEPIVGGDARHPAISCASIVAKVVRDRLMRFYHTLWPEYALDEHKGYGTEGHRACLQRFGPCVLHRRSFAPVALLAQALAGAAAGPSR